MSTDSDDALLAADAAVSQLAERASPQAELGFQTPQTAGQKSTWAHQEVFLSALPEAGNILEAAKASGVADRTAREWYADDYLGFRRRYDAAMILHREHLEGLMFRALHEAAPKDLLNHPVLPIFALKGAWRDKYGDQVQVAGGTAIQIVFRGIDGGQIRTSAIDGKAPSPTILDGGKPSQQPQLPAP